MQRTIINHWTAGLAKPNATDFEHYHYLIDQDGNIYKGDHTIEDNDNTADGDYAAHCGGGNTKRYGISLCGMMDFKSNKSPGKYKLTEIQLETLYMLNAKILFKEGFKEVNSNNLMTHMEFGNKNPKTSSYGKIDICYLPTNPSVTSEKVGDFIRNKTSWYLNRLILGSLTSEVKVVN